jgi:hypothetical protein
MVTRIEATFQIVDRVEEVYDQPEAGPRLTRVTITKHYAGAIEGHGVAHVLTAQGETGAGYVASERVVGSLDGRRGSFVVQHGGVLDAGMPSTSGTVVPDSGTDELAGIRGQASESQPGVLTLDVSLEQ